MLSSIWVVGCQYVTNWFTRQFFIVQFFGCSHWVLTHTDVLRQIVKWECNSIVTKLRLYYYTTHGHLISLFCSSYFPMLVWAANDSFNNHKWIGRRKSHIHGVKQLHHKGCYLWSCCWPAANMFAQSWPVPQSPLPRRTFPHCCRPIGFFFTHNSKHFLMLIHHNSWCSPS